MQTKKLVHESMNEVNASVHWTGFAVPGVTC
jgi:hypothetical protein